MRNDHDDTNELVGGPHWGRAFLLAGIGWLAFIGFIVAVVMATVTWMSPA